MALPLAAQLAPLALKEIFTVYEPALSRFGRRSRCFVSPGDSPTARREYTFLPRVGVCP